MRIVHVLSGTRGSMSLYRILDPFWIPVWSHGRFFCGPHPRSVTYSDHKSRHLRRVTRRWRSWEVNYARIRQLCVTYAGQAYIGFTHVKVLACREASYEWSIWFLSKRSVSLCKIRSWIILEHNHRLMIRHSFHNNHVYIVWYWEKMLVYLFEDSIFWCEHSV